MNTRELERPSIDIGLHEYPAGTTPAALRAPSARTGERVAAALADGRGEVAAEIARHGASCALNAEGRPGGDAGPLRLEPL